MLKWIVIPLIYLFIHLFFTPTSSFLKSRSVSVHELQSGKRWSKLWTAFAFSMFYIRHFYLLFLYNHLLCIYVRFSFILRFGIWCTYLCCPSLKRENVQLLVTACPLLPTWFMNHETKPNRNWNRNWVLRRVGRPDVNSCEFGPV